MMRDYLQSIRITKRSRRNMLWQFCLQIDFLKILMTCYVTDTFLLPTSPVASLKPLNCKRRHTTQYKCMIFDPSVVQIMAELTGGKIVGIHFDHFALNKECYYWFSV